MEQTTSGIAVNVFPSSEASKPQKASEVLEALALMLKEKMAQLSREREEICTALAKKSAEIDGIDFAYAKIGPLLAQAIKREQQPK